MFSTLHVKMIMLLTGFQMSRKLLCENGFQYVWINPYCIDPHTFVMDFKNRLIDCFKQKWYADIIDSRILYYYY